MSLFYELTSPVVGLHCSRQFYFWMVLPDVHLHWKASLASGGNPRRLLLPSWDGVLPSALNKGYADGARSYFGHCQTRVGLNPAPGLTTNTALCHIRPLVG